jgi:hypothetical protein
MTIPAKATTIFSNPDDRRLRYAYLLPLTGFPKAEAGRKRMADELSTHPPIELPEYCQNEAQTGTESNLAKPSETRKKRKRNRL